MTLMGSKVSKPNKILNLQSKKILKFLKMSDSVFMVKLCMLQCNLLSHIILKSMIIFTFLYKLESLTNSMLFLILFLMKLPAIMMEKWEKRVQPKRQSLRI